MKFSLFLLLFISFGLTSTGTVRSADSDTFVRGLEAIIESGDQYEKMDAIDRLLNHYGASAAYADYIETVSRLISAYE